jgi:ankyrin repeat protein
MPNDHGSGEAAGLPTSPIELIETIIARRTADAVAGLSANPAIANGRDDYIGSTPLHFAAHRGLEEIVAALLDAGADVHARERVSATTPLHWAAEGGHAGIAARLLDAGADIEARDGWYGLTPLGWTAIVDWSTGPRGDREAVAALLEKRGAAVDPFVAVNTGNVGALRAAAAGDPTALQRRMGFVAFAMQPLHLAVAENRPDMVDALLDLGAPIDARTEWGLTPLALALKNGQEELAARLRAGGARDDMASALVAGNAAAFTEAPDEPELPSRLIFVAAREGYAAAIGPLVARGANFNARVKHLVGERPQLVTPLLVAVRAGHLDTSRALLVHGANPSPGNLEGIPTPLHLAAGAGREDLARLLLEHGADPMAEESGFNATPAMWADHEGHTELARILRFEDHDEIPESFWEEELGDGEAPPRE